MALSKDEAKQLWKQSQAFLQFFHLLLSLLIFVFIIVALCGGTWLYSMVEVGLYQDHEYFVGLWQVCFNLYDYGCPTEMCSYLGSDVDDYIQVTRAFLIMSTLSALFALIGGIAMMCSQRVKGQVSAVCHVVTAVFTLIAMATYTAKVNEIDAYDIYSYGWSYAIGWIVFILAVLSAIIAAVFGTPKLPRVIIEFRG